MVDKNKKKTGWSFGASLALLTVLAVFTLSFGFATILKSLRGPFVGLINVNQNLSSNLINQGPSVEEQKNTDTDKDGLNDFDELYIYKTSPYLEDTDSDGYKDKEEIETSHNPNCPFGESCQNGSPTTNSNINTNTPPANTNASTNTAGSELDLTQLESLTPAQIREALLETGSITKEQLDQIDDATLIQLYQEAVKENTNTSPQ